MSAVLSKDNSARTSGLYLVVIAFVLSLLGLLNVLSSTLVRAFEQGKFVSILFLKQSAFLCLAAVTCWFFARSDYKKIVEKSSRLLPLIWLGLLAVLIFGERTFGAKRWVDFGFFSLQVSELAKLVIVFCCARYVSGRRHCIHEYRRGFLPAMAWLGITIALIALEPDFGTSMFILTTAFLLLFLGGMRLLHIILSGLLVLPPFLALMMMTYPHILSRLSGFNNGPHEQVTRALYAMGGGGALGRGLGSGRAHLKFIRFIESDFIFASVGEQLGFLGTITIVVLFALFFWHGLKITLRAPDHAGFIVAFGFTFMIVFQAGINMAVVTGLVPPKGIGLPFVSYGGSSLLVLSAAVGTLLNVAKQGQDQPVGAEEKTDPNLELDGGLEEPALYEQ